MGSEETRASSELDASFGAKFGSVCGEFIREMDEVLQTMEDRTVSGSQSSCSAADVSQKLSFESANGSLQKLPAEVKQQEAKNEVRNMELFLHSQGFQPGDMVWGKVKSHPWWPGHLFNEAFASASVRRSRRDGHVLVAFFGDSSYGWFDPAELIPFDPHYAEKSRQTSSRNFMKAVEEAVDEAGRRRALGLACRCRNLNNFRPMNVPDYFVVDVEGYEPGGVYSLKQIAEARNSFQPAEALSFVQRVALAPRDGEQTSINWIRTMATVLAYRKAIFEEFDETYAQAFGVEAVRPSRNSLGQLEQSERVIRAPLSGPLVIAEALGERTVGYSKPVKAKVSFKKDKYLFKRRDEPVDLRPKPKQFHCVSLTKSDVLSAPAGVADYVFQKGIPSLDEKQSIQPTKQEQKPQIREETVPEQKPQIREETAPGYVGQIAVTARQSSGDAAVQSLAVDTFSGQEFDKVRNAVQDVTVKAGLGEAAVSTSRDGFVFPHKSETSTVYDAGKLVSESLKPDDAVVADSKDSEKVNLWVAAEQNLVEIPVNAFVKPGELDQGIGGSCTRSLSESSGTIPFSVANLSGDIPVKAMIDGAVTSFEGRVIGKKVKARAPKQPWKESSPGTAFMEEKKKKKKKTEDSGMSTEADRPRKLPKFDKNGELVKDSESVGSGWDNLQTNSHKDFSLAIAQVNDGAVKVEPSLPELVSDMLSLALDPFHGYERNCAATVRQVFLRFRSLVYQKSLILPPASELDTVEQVVGRSNLDRMQSEYGVSNSEETNISQTKLKSVKPVSTSGHSEKLSRKRSHSDQQDEVTAKRQKKLKELKSMALAKNSSQKLLQDGQRGERKETATVPAKPVKPDSGRKLEPLPEKVAQPMILSMRFPQGTSIPSMPQLKARFARFGPLVLSGTRVYYQTGTCRVVFKHRSDAKAAYEHATRNYLFGQTRVIYQLKEIHVPAPDPPDSGKRRVDDVGGEVRPAPQHQQGPSLQLKSCLKKPVSDDAGPVSVPPVKESPRVKFLLGVEEREHLVNSNNASGADGASASVGLDVNKNAKMVLPPLVPLSHTLQHSTASHETAGTAANFSKAQPNFSDVGPRKNVDISHQLLSLLMRLNDVVSDVKCTLGYVPYHPL